MVEAGIGGRGNLWRSLVVLNGPGPRMWSNFAGADAGQASVHICEKLGCGLLNRVIAPTAKMTCCCNLAGSRKLDVFPRTEMHWPHPCSEN